MCFFVRYFPHPVDNLITRHKQKTRHSKIDQDNLKVMVERIKVKEPEGNIMFCPSTDNEETNEKEDLLFVYQVKL